MISNPIDYVKDFADAGADLICFHLESSSNVCDTIKKIRDCGKKVGISLKPNTPAQAIFPYINDIDMALVMTVEPGFGGQSFMSDMMSKITEIRGYANKSGHQLDIQVDGGVNLETGKLCVNAGANILVAGSFLFNSENPYDMVEALKLI